MKLLERESTKHLRKTDEQAIVGYNRREMDFYHIDIETERVEEIDLGLSFKKINDICDLGGSVFAATDIGVISLDPEKPGKHTGKQIDCVAALDEELVYSENGDEVRTKNNKIWSDPFANIREIYGYKENVYIGVEENHKSVISLYTANDGFIEDVEVPKRVFNQACYMTEHQGDLYGSFNQITWRLNNDNKIEIIGDQMVPCIGLFEYDDNLIEARRGLRKYDERLKKECVIGEEHLPEVTEITSISRSGLDNATREINKTYEIELKNELR